MNIPGAFRATIDNTYTGQYSNVPDFGLMFYNARWYDPYLNRFAQADTIVPDGIQGFDRYAYVNNNPLNYIDPTGHFKQSQLEKWFGKNWTAQFNEAWQQLLEKAELGDLVVFGDLAFVFAIENDMLVGWDINKRFSESPTSSILSLSSGSGSLALYRSVRANQDGGPTQNSGVIMPGELTTPEHGLFNDSNHYIKIIGDLSLRKQYPLPLDWYMGWSKHVQVRQHFSGFDPGIPWGTTITTGYGIFSAVSAAGKVTISASIKGAGGPVGVLALTIDVASWTLWDTNYVILPGSGNPAVPLIPTPGP